MDQPQVQLLHDTFFDFAVAQEEETPTTPLSVAELDSVQRQLHPVPTLRLVDDELRDASFLQRELCPRNLPDVSGASLLAWSRSKGSVGGDLYDVFRLDESHIGFWIVDATGHSVSSALLASLARGVLGTHARTAGCCGKYDPLDALDLLNVELLGHNFADCSFVAAICGTYDEKTGELQWVRAGAPAPLGVNEAGDVTRLSSDGTVLGMIENPTLERHTHVLAHGETISFFTDGLEELPLDWAMVLRESAASSSRSDDAPLSRYPSHSLDALLEILEEAAGDESLSDDVTVLTFRASR